MRLFSSLSGVAVLATFCGNIFASVGLSVPEWNGDAASCRPLPKTLCDPKDPKARNILITGSGGSGTHSFAKLFRMNGIDLEHDGMGADGSVAWPYFVDAAAFGVSPPAYILPCSHKFRHVIHIVRHPLEVISTMATHSYGSLNFLHQTLDVPEDHGHHHGLKFRMLAWLRTQQFVESYAGKRYRIDQIGQIFPEVCHLTGYPACKCDNALAPTAAENHRHHTNLSWGDLEEADQEVANEIRGMAKRYGFNDNPKRCAHLGADQVLTTEIPCIGCPEKNSASDDAGDDLEFVWDKITLEMLFARNNRTTSRNASC